MKRGIFRILLLLLSVVLLLGLVGCGSRDYEIHEVDGRFYVKFDTEWEPWENPHGREPYVAFPSLAAMQAAFLRGWLFDDETISYRCQLEETEYGYPARDGSSAFLEQIQFHHCFSQEKRPVMTHHDRSFRLVYVVLTRASG